MRKKTNRAFLVKENEEEEVVIWFLFSGVLCCNELDSLKIRMVIKNLAERELLEKEVKKWHKFRIKNNRSSSVMDESSETKINISEASS